MADIILTQHVLGMKPFVLIEAVKDDQGELKLQIEAGGGAERDVAALPFLMLTTVPDNLITAILREMRERVEAGDPDLNASVQVASLTTIQKVAEALGVDL